MAGFFEKVGEMAKSAADKTTDAIEVTKLNTKVSKEEQKIKNLKAEIGQHFLDLFNAGEHENLFVAEKAVAVEQCEKEKAIYQDMIKEIKVKI